GLTDAHAPAPPDAPGGPMDAHAPAPPHAAGLTDARAPAHAGPGDAAAPRTPAAPGTQPPQASRPKLAAIREGCSTRSFRTSLARLRESRTRGAHLITCRTRCSQAHSVSPAARVAEDLADGNLAVVVLVTDPAPAWGRTQARPRWRGVSLRRQAWRLS